MGKSQDAEKMGWRPEEKGAGEERVHSGDTLKRLLMKFRDLGVDRKPWGLARVCRVPPKHVLDLTAFPAVRRAGLIWADGIWTAGLCQL